MRAILIALVGALFLLSFHAQSEYVGNGNYSPTVTISGEGCGNLVANMGMTCAWRGDTTDILLNVKNLADRPRELTVQSTVKGRRLLNGGFEEEQKIQLEALGQYSGTAVKIFTHSDFADVRIVLCRDI